MLKHRAKCTQKKVELGIVIHPGWMICSYHCSMRFERTLLVWCPDFRTHHLDGAETSPTKKPNRWQTQIQVAIIQLWEVLRVLSLMFRSFLLCPLHPILLQNRTFRFLDEIWSIFHMGWPLQLKWLNANVFTFSTILSGVAAFLEWRWDNFDLVLVFKFHGYTLSLSERSCMG